MSERTDAIRSRLTAEWKSSRQISDEVKAMGFDCRSCIVYSVLDSDRKYGLAEMMTVRSRSGRMSMWRLPEAVE